MPHDFISITKRQRSAAILIAMDDTSLIRTPPLLEHILRETRALGFTMASEPQTGAFLRALAATKPGGRLLELGTGTGVGTAWLLDGMDADARLDSVDNDENVVAIARRHLGADARVTFHVIDGEEFLRRRQHPEYDLIYADAWPGKYSCLRDALALVKPGGIYFVDDLLPQANWPPGHEENVAPLIARLEQVPVLCLSSCPGRRA